MKLEELVSQINYLRESGDRVGLRAPIELTLLFDSQKGVDRLSVKLFKGERLPVVSRAGVQEVLSVLNEGLELIESRFIEKKLVISFYPAKVVINRAGEAVIMKTGPRKKEFTH